MKVLHASAECYPAAKVGGLADVVGSLPKFLLKHDVQGKVIIPKYSTEWIKNHSFYDIHEGVITPGGNRIPYKIQREEADSCGFPLYVVDLPNHFNRSGIYGDPETGLGYADEFERYISFQVAILDWLKSYKAKPDVIHCHDHHTSFLPFLMTHSPVYHEFAGIPSVLTVHNAQYHGWYSPEKEAGFPKYNPDSAGFLYWNGQINALSCGIRTCWQLSTVSPTYMEELQYQSNGLEPLFAHEKPKSAGIINGIDIDVWNPNTDSFIAHNYNRRSYKSGKQKNKEALCRRLNMDESRPVFAFIGRLVEEKGTDLIPDLLRNFIDYDGNQVNFVILGTGTPEIQERLKAIETQFPDYVRIQFAYDEALSHQIYAGADYLFMPSRVEPCGLNQMYAMRYGTIPIVRETGGLKDTVIDYDYSEGYGITFREFNLTDAGRALHRGVVLKQDEQRFRKLQRYIMGLDFSWQRSAGEYKKMYQRLINRFK